MMIGDRAGRIILGSRGRGEEVKEGRYARKGRDEGDDEREGGKEGGDVQRGLSHGKKKRE